MWEFNGNGKTGVLLIRILYPYFYMGQYVVLDSGFCVLKAICDLEKWGCTVAISKKMEVLAKGCSGEVMQSVFIEDEVNMGDCNVLRA